MASKPSSRSRIPVIRTSPPVALQTSATNSSKAKAPSTYTGKSLSRAPPLRNTPVSTGRISTRPVAVPLPKKPASPQLQKPAPVSIPKKSRTEAIQPTAPKCLVKRPPGTRLCDGNTAATVTVNLRNDSLLTGCTSSFVDNTKDSINVPKTNETITNDEVNNALVGLIMPSSDHSLSKCYQLTSTVEDETAKCIAMRESQKKTTGKHVTINDDLFVTSTSENDTTLKSVEPPHGVSTHPVTPHLDASDTFFQGYTSMDVVSASSIAAQNMRHHAETLFIEYAETAGKQAAVLKMDCDEIADQALLYMQKKFSAKNEAGEGTNNQFMDNDQFNDMEAGPMINCPEKHERFQIWGETILPANDKHTTLAFVAESINEAHLTQEIDDMQFQFRGNVVHSPCHQARHELPQSIQMKYAESNNEIQKSANVLQETKKTVYPEAEPSPVVSINKSINHDYNYNERLDVVSNHKDGGILKQMSGVRGIPVSELESMVLPESYQEVPSYAQLFCNKLYKIETKEGLNQHDQSDFSQHHRQNAKNNTNWQYISNVDGTDEDVVQVVTYSENEEDAEIEEARELLMANLGKFHKSKNNSISSANTKKPKTIFSVDTPLTNVQVESGPGENGDGRGVCPLSINEKFGGAKKEVRITDGDGISNLSRFDIRTSPSNFKLDRGDSVQRLRDSKIEGGYLNVLNDTINGIVDNLYQTATEEVVTPDHSAGDLVPGSENYLKSNDAMKSKHVTHCINENECRAVIPKNLILERYCNAHFNGFRTLFPIYNPTSSCYAFKVCLCRYPVSGITASPSIGFLRPESSCFVELSANRTAINHTDAAFKNAIEINIFPINCMNNEPEELNTRYQMLSSQCPALILTQTVERVILWDNGNIKDNLDLINSIDDKDEQQRVKSELHLNGRGSRDIRTRKSSYSLLKRMTRQILDTNSHLNEMFLEIGFFKKCLTTALILYILFITASSYFSIKSPPPPPKEEFSIYKYIFGG